MAKVFQRVWRSGPRKVKRAALGLHRADRGEARAEVQEAWTKEDAEKAL
jgi:hypothetical protein